MAEPSIRSTARLHRVSGHRHRLSWNFRREGHALFCAGCRDAASLRVNAIKLYKATSGAGEQIDQGGPGSQPCASINGGGTACNPTATRARTWGQLKSLYR